MSIKNMQNLSYLSDLPDNEWHLLAPRLPRASTPGRPRKYTWRSILNAIFYVLRTGCQWRFLLHDFPKWKTVEHYFRRWRTEHTWKRIHTRLLPPTQTKAQFPCLAHVWLDAGYNGSGKGKDWIEKTLGWTTTTIRLPLRRVLVLEDVERPFSWWSQSRRLRKGYERLCASTEAMLYAVMSRLMVRRLAAA